MQTNPDQLTAEEKQRLAPYVTDTEGTIFVLTGLPDMVKGALFSRYSRSTKGLRRLLLDEFMQGEGAALNDWTAGTTTAKDAGGAAARARDFYDRILDGYGDDSIGELGGAHLAVEQVSMVATKVLEDARIGGSPLEKSTRYVPFGDLVDGDYRFYKEPRLLASPHGDLYLATCRALFKGYNEMMAPMLVYLEQAAPKTDDVSEAAWRRSLKARAFDALRGLLPAATLTNMGIFGNGRFFESLLLRLQLNGLAELDAIAQAAWGELDKVVPSLVRRANPAHRHFKGYRDHAQAEQALLAALSNNRSQPAALPSRGVGLVDFDPLAEEKVLAALAFPHSTLSVAELRQWARGMPEAERLRVFQGLADARTNRRHKPGRALEMPVYTFDLLGDFGLYRDLHRHRTLTQMRQPLSTRYGFEMPTEVAQAGLTQSYEALMAQAAHAWETLAGEFPLEAQYVVPMAYRIRWTMTINFRALLWLVELRSQPQGHPAYRQMAQDLYRCVAEVHPRLAVLMRYVDMESYALGRLDAEEKLEQKRSKGGG